MKAIVKALTVAAALIALATPAMAVDFVGYFRDGTAISSQGGPAGTFGVGPWKARLGNENDNYGEWGFEQTIYKDKAGVEAKVGVMFAYYQGASTPGDAKFTNSTDKDITGCSKAAPCTFNTNPGIQQNYVTIKFPQWAGMKLWGGKMYYLREDVGPIDFFYLNTGSTPGIGATDIDVGMGKLAFSLFGVGGSDLDKNTVAFLRPDARWYGIPIVPNGTLTFDLNYYLISRHKDAVHPQSGDELGGLWATAEWNQGGILGGSNALVAQYANGANAAMGPTPGTPHKDRSQWRILDALTLTPNNVFSVTLGGSYVQTKAEGKTGNTSYGVFARPVYWVSDYFKIQGDVAYTNSKPKGGKAANLFKATIAPSISPAVGEGGPSSVRPELRVFATYGSWNDQAGIGGFGTEKSGLLLGAQVETWF